MVSSGCLNSTDLVLSEVSSAALPEDEGGKLGTVRSGYLNPSDLVLSEASSVPFPEEGSVRGSSLLKGCLGPLRSMERWVPSGTDCDLSVLSLGIVIGDPLPAGCVFPSGS